MQIKKGASSRRVEDKGFPGRHCRQEARQIQELGYVDAVLLPILALDRFHLIFEAEVQLFQPDFFQLLVFAEITFLGEYIKTLGILRMLLNQAAEFVVTGQELVSRS